MKTIPKTSFLLLIFIFCLLLNTHTSANLDDCPVPTMQGEVKWFFEWDPSNPDTIDRQTQVAVSVTGGIAPYDWSVSGSGFSLAESQTQGLSNILYADDTACGSAFITVADAQGAVDGSVRVPDHGRWVTICYGSQDCWQLCGEPTTSWYTVSYYRWEAVKVQGGYRQFDGYGAWCGYGAAYCDDPPPAWDGPECLTRPQVLPMLASDCGNLPLKKVNPAYYKTDCWNNVECRGCVTTIPGNISYQEWQCN